MHCFSGRISKAVVIGASLIIGNSLANLHAHEHETSYLLSTLTETD